MSYKHISKMTPDEYDKFRKMRRKMEQNYRTNIMNAIFDILGHECARCGFSDRRALQIDHVYGGGTKERRENNSGNTAVYRKILTEVLQGTDKYQILCANCNYIKRSENGELKQRKEGG